MGDGRPESCGHVVASMSTICLECWWALEDRVRKAEAGDVEKSRLLETASRQIDGLIHAAHENAAEIERLKADGLKSLELARQLEEVIQEREAAKWDAAKLGEDRDFLKLQVRDLTSLLRRAEDALGPDRTESDRRATLMVLGKALVEKRVCEHPTARKFGTDGKYCCTNCGVEVEERRS